MDTPIIIKKKKGHGEHAHHGGSWKVAYADFVTAMMAFFMVMWIMGLSQDVKTQIQGYFNDPIGFVKNAPKSKSIFTVKGMPTPKPGPSRKGQFDSMTIDQDKVRYLSQQVKKAITGAPDLREILKQVKVSANDEGLLIELRESADAVFFESGKAVLTPRAESIIRAIGPVLGRSGRKLVIEGHTDAKPYGGMSYTNWDLSTDRAKSMLHALITNGVQDTQIMGIRGCGSTQLIKPSDPYGVANRRVNILLPYKKEEDQDKPAEEAKGSVDQTFANPIDLHPKIKPFPGR